MTNQEALDLLNDMSFTNDYPTLSRNSEKIDEAVKILQELVDKATPKKPNNIIFLWGTNMGKCPICDLQVMRMDNYCHQCGQALDWGKE